MSMVHSSPKGGLRFLFVSCAALLLGAAPAPATACHHHDHDDDDLSPELVATFDASAFETPESMAIDTRDNIFVNLALTGEIRKISAQGAVSTFATLPLGAPPGTPCGAFVGGLTGLAIDGQDNLYASVA